jgi:hypothetical protein
MAHNCFWCFPVGKCWMTVKRFSPFTLRYILNKTKPFVKYIPFFRQQIYLVYIICSCTDFRNLKYK